MDPPRRKRTPRSFPECLSKATSVVYSRPPMSGATITAVTRDWRRHTHWMVAAGVPTVVTALHSAFYGPWIVDDAGLTFAYARSLSSGAGPVLQPGSEPVEGFSNPAWLAVLTVGRWLRLVRSRSLVRDCGYRRLPQARGAYLLLRHLCGDVRRGGQGEQSSGDGDHRRRHRDRARSVVRHLDHERVGEWAIRVRSNHARRGPRPRRRVSDHDNCAHRHLGRWVGGVGGAHATRRYRLRGRISARSVVDSRP